MDKFARDFPAHLGYHRGAMLDYIVLVFAGCAAGYLGGAVRSLAQHRLSLSLQLRVKDLEERLLREDRRYAGTLSRSKRDIDREILEQAAATLQKPQVNESPWPPGW